jgi:hypothetical protein
VKTKKVINNVINNVVFGSENSVSSLRARFIMLGFSALFLLLHLFATSSESGKVSCSLNTKFSKSQNSFLLACTHGASKRAQFDQMFLQYACCSFLANYLDSDT